MDARHAHVVHMLHVVAHHLGRDDGFFGHGNVAGARRHHHDLSLAGVVSSCDNVIARASS